MTRSISLSLTAAGLLVAFINGPAAAVQPSSDSRFVRPIRWVDPFPGGGTDVLVRTIAVPLTETLGQWVVVDNRSGASGNIAVDTVAKANPDGYTIGTITTTHSINPSVNPHLPYNLLRDLQPVVQLSSQPYTLVTYASWPVNNIQQLVALARAKPGQVTYGSAGVAGLTHLAGALLGMLTKIDIVHVPYKGGAPALTDVMGERIQLLFVSSFVSMPHVKANRVKVLGVSSAKRVSALPEVPTIAESGVPGFDVTGWYGVVAPVKAPAQLVNQLNREIARILQTQQIRDRLISEGAEPVGGTPEAFWRHVRNEVEKWRKVVKMANVRLE